MKSQRTSLPAYIHVEHDYGWSLGVASMRFLLLWVGVRCIERLALDVDEMIPKYF